MDASKYDYWTAREIVAGLALAGQWPDFNKYRSAFVPPKENVDGLMGALF